MNKNLLEEDRSIDELGAKIDVHIGTTGAKHHIKYMLTMREPLCYPRSQFYSEIARIHASGKPRVETIKRRRKRKQIKISKRKNRR